MRERERDKSDNKLKDNTEDRVCVSDFKLKVHKMKTHDLSYKKDKFGMAKTNVNDEFNLSEFEVSVDSKEYKLNS